MKRLLKFCGYSIYFIVMLVVFVVLAFPSDRVRRYAERQLSAQTGGTVRIGDLQLGLDGTVTLENVQITLAMPDPANQMPGRAGAPGSAETPKDDGERNESTSEQSRIQNPPVFIVMDRLDIEANFVGALLGKPLAITVNGEVQNGTIKNLQVTQVPGGWHIKAEDISGINLAPTRLTKRFLGTDIWTTFSTGKEFDFTWRGSLPQSEGTVDLMLGATEIPHVMFKDPVAGPLGEAFDVAVGDVSVRVTLGKEEKTKRRRNTNADEQTVLKIEELKSRGEHLLLNLGGAAKNEIRFTGPSAKTGLLDIKFVFSFTKEFFEWKGTGVRETGEKVPNASHIGLKFVLESPGGPLARSRVGRKETGFRYGYRCRGMLSDPKCTPERPSRAIVPKLNRGTTPTGSRPPVGTSTGRNKPKSFNRPKANPSRPPTPRNSYKRSGRPTPSTGRSKARMVEPARPTKKSATTGRISRKPVPTPTEVEEADSDEPVPNPLEPSVPPTVSEEEDEEEAEDEDEDDDDVSLDLDEDEDDSDDDYEDD